MSGSAAGTPTVALDTVGVGPYTGDSFARPPMHGPLVSFVASERADFDERCTEFVRAVDAAGARVAVEGVTADSRGRTLPFGTGGPAGAAAAAMVLVARWSESPPDLVHVADLDVLPAVALACRLIARPKVVATLDAAFEARAPRGATVRARAGRRGYFAWLAPAVRAADRYVALHGPARDSWVALGVPRERVVVLDSGWGVDLSGLVGAPRAASAGERSEVMRVAVAGTDPERAGLADALAAAGVGAVTVDASGPRDARRAGLAEADLLVSLRTEVSQAVEVQEAMALGLPVVATRVPGHTGIIRHRESGVLVAPGDLEGVVRAVSALSDPSVRAAAGDRARALAARLFDRDLAVRKVLAVYDELLGGDASGPARVTSDGRVVSGRELV